MYSKNNVEEFFFKKWINQSHHQCFTYAFKMTYESFEELDKEAQYLFEHFGGKRSLTEAIEFFKKTQLTTALVDYLDVVVEHEIEQNKQAEKQHCSALAVLIKPGKDFDLLLSSLDSSQFEVIPFKHIK